MKLAYEELLSNAPIKVDGIGTVCPKTINEIMFKGGIGYKKYRFLLQIFIYSKEDVVKNFYKESIANKLLESDKINLFDLMILNPFTKASLQEALDFFLLETPVWVGNCGVFAMRDENDKVVGTVDRNNFEQLKDYILPLNYVFLKNNNKTPKYTSEKAKELWNRAQKFIKELDQKNKQPEKENNFDLGNVVSKLCIIAPSYNLLNVGQLTVYQLYDQFFQYATIRSADLSDQAFLRVGGKDHNFDYWLTPIYKNN